MQIINRKTGEEHKVSKAMWGTLVEKGMAKRFIVKEAAIPEEVAAMSMSNEDETKHYWSEHIVSKDHPIATVLAFAEKHGVENIDFEGEKRKTLINQFNLK